EGGVARGRRQHLEVGAVDRKGGAATELANRGRRRVERGDGHAVVLRGGAVADEIEQQSWRTRRGSGSATIEEGRRRDERDLAGRLAHRDELERRLRDV